MVYKIIYKVVVVLLALSVTMRGSSQPLTMPRSTIVRHFLLLVTQ